MPVEAHRGVSLGGGDDRPMPKGALPRAQRPRCYALVAASVASVHGPLGTSLWAP
jgi:hypothetical protein